MSTADEERDFWEAKADTLENAKAAIAASESAWSGEILTACLELILPYIDAAPHRRGKGHRVLDLGCGAGRLTIPVAMSRPEAELHGADISASMLVLGAARAQEASVTNVSWHLGNGRHLPEDVGRLDAAYSMIMLQHIPRRAQAGYLRQVAAQLVRGGIFRFQTLCGTAEEFMHHHVDANWINIACAEAGLRVESIDELRPFGSPDDAPMSLWVTARKL